MTLPRFEYFAPETLEEALLILSENRKNSYLMAGGTDLLMKMRHGGLRPSAIIWLKRIKGLDKINFNAQKGLTIGATALIADVASHPRILKKYPAIAHAAGVMANVQIRNMGTVAGNICNAAPSADNAPPLMAMDAEAILTGPNGERRLPIDAFFKGPGLTAIEPGEIMTAIFVPLPPIRSGSSYKRVSERGKVDIAAVNACAMVSMEGATCKDIRIVLGAVAPVPMRATKAENILRGKRITKELIEKAGEQASRESKPISDVRASAEYRKKMVAVLTKNALKEAHTRAIK